MRTATIAGMDATDREILGELTRNARISFRDLGAAVGLSANAAADRVRRLARDRRDHWLHRHDRPGRRRPWAVAYIDVRLAAQVPTTEFEAEASKLEAVMDAVHVTGRFDYQLRVACRDTRSSTACCASSSASAA